MRCPSHRSTAPTAVATHKLQCVYQISCPQELDASQAAFAQLHNKLKYLVESDTTADHDHLRAEISRLADDPTAFDDEDQEWHSPDLVSPRNLSLALAIMDGAQGDDNGVGDMEPEPGEDSPRNRSISLAIEAALAASDDDEAPDRDTNTPEERVEVPVLDDGTGVRALAPAGEGEGSAPAANALGSHVAPKLGRTSHAALVELEARLAAQQRAQDKQRAALDADKMAAASQLQAAQHELAAHKTRLEEAETRAAQAGRQAADVGGDQQKSLVPEARPMSDEAKLMLAAMQKENQLLRRELNLAAGGQTREKHAHNAIVVCGILRCDAHVVILDCLCQCARVCVRLSRLRTGDSGLRSSLERAERMARADQHGEAIALYTNALRCGVVDCGVYDARAASYMAHGRFANALEVTHHALQKTNSLYSVSARAART